MKRFCTDGLGGFLFLSCALFCVFMLHNSAVSRVAGRVLLPAWSTSNMLHADRVRELAKTDERYAQCATDTDACADLSVTGQLPLGADAALWFCIGGSASLLSGLRSKAKR